MCIRDRGYRAFYEGLRYLLARPRILSLALVKAAWCLAASTTLLLTVYGETVFPIWGSTVIGVTGFYVFRGLGTGLGPIVSRSLAGENQWRMEVLIGLSFAIGSIAYFGVASAQHVAIALVLVATAHLGGATAWVFSTVRIQQTVPNQLMGRVFAFEQAGFTVTYSLCTALHGYMLDAEWLNVRMLAATISGGLALMALSWAGRMMVYRRT